MKKNFNNDYNNLKHNYYKNKGNTNSFFSGLKEISGLELYKEKKKTHVHVYNMIYNLKYAIIIFIIGLLLIISISPFMHRIYIEKKYKQVLYNEIISSYFVDVCEISYEESIDLQDEFINNYLDTGVNGIYW